jgi:exopolysaccharide biosynthesis polyprenyl glycosylphosphotransferase
MTFRRAILVILYKLSDIAILFCGLSLTLVIVGVWEKPVELIHVFSKWLTVMDFVAIIFGGLTWHIIFQLMGLYETKRFSWILEESIDVLKATSLGTCILSGIAVFFYPWVLQTAFVFIFWIITTILTVFIRMIMRLILIMFRYRGRNLRHIIIVGTNERGLKFADHIMAHKEMGYHILGFVDKGYKAEPGPIDMLSDLDHFPDVLDRYIVDEVIIALPLRSFYDEIMMVVDLCKEQGLKIRLIADTFIDSSSSYRSTVEYLDDVPFFTLHIGPRDGLFLRIKRLMDVVISAVALIALLPLFLVVGILIKLDSPGPVFFVHERVGYNKRRFDFYKFRTMTEDAEKKQVELEKLNEVDGPVFKIKNDPRVTKIGKYLRRTSIDEFPQLINVLKGDMSLVGPRPLPIRDYILFDKNWQKRRFSVKPGLTCLWQIQGRNELSFDKWIELDMEYIDHWSLRLDLKILIKTIPAVFSGRGAS